MKAKLFSLALFFLCAGNASTQENQTALDLAYKSRAVGESHRVRADSVFARGLPLTSFGRDRGRLLDFCAEVAKTTGVAVQPATSAEAAVRGADIVVTITTSSRPVLEGAWLSPGAHINAAGGNFPQKRELDDAAIARVGLFAADSVEQSKLEAGDLIQPFASDPARWNDVRELADIVAGNTPGSTSADQITLFKSNGIAIEDVAVAARVFELAVERQVGTRIPLWEHRG